MNDELPTPVSEPPPPETSAALPGPRLVLLANSAMRARRRPAAIVVAWGFELVLAAAVSWPLASYVNGAYGAHPLGDAPLYRPGGLALADLVIRMKAVLPSLTAHVSPLLGLGAVLGLLPIALLVVQIAYATPSRKPPPLKLSLARAWGAVPRLVTLLIAMGFVEGLLLLGGILAAGATAQGTEHSLGEARSQQLGAVVFFVFAIVVAAAGVLHDVARTAAIRFDVGALRALRLAGNAMRRGVLALMWSWTWRAVIGLLPVVIAAALSAKLAGHGAAAFWAIALIHQLVILTRVALRASWLAKALRVVDDAHKVRRASA